MHVLSWRSEDIKEPHAKFTISSMWRAFIGMHAALLHGWVRASREEEKLQLIAMERPIAINCMHACEKYH